MSDAGPTDAIARAQPVMERCARAGCTPGQIAATLWASHVTDRVTAAQMVRDQAEDITAWKLAGRADVAIAAYDGAVGIAKLSPGQASVQAAWGTQHLGWGKAGIDPAKQGQTENREAAAAGKLKVAGT
jgi:hypothetical protein